MGNKEYWKFINWALLSFSPNRFCLKPCRSAEFQQARKNKAKTAKPILSNTYFNAQVMQSVLR